MEKEKFDGNKHNLRHALMKALTENDQAGLCKAAQDIFDAGYELEEMDLLPNIFKIACNNLTAAGWSPNIKQGMDI